MTDHDRSGTTFARRAAVATPAPMSCARPLPVEAPPPAPTAEHRLLVVRHRERAVRSLHRAHRRSIWP